MRVKVDFDSCEANAVCEGLAPEVFRVDDDDMLHVLAEPTDATADGVRRAVASCPKTALSLVEDD